MERILRGFLLCFVLNNVCKATGSGASPTQEIIMDKPEMTWRTKRSIWSYQCSDSI